MFVHKVKLYEISVPWIFLGRGQDGERTTYAKAVRELAFLVEGQVVQYIQDGYIPVAGKKAGWVNGAGQKGLWK